MIIFDDRYCKGCGICIHFCPKRVLKVSHEVSRRGYYTPYVDEGGECTNCRQCELFCPDLAIFIFEEKEAGDG